MEKDPDQWITGDEPRTGAQRRYRKTLYEEAKADFSDKRRPKLYCVRD